MAVLTVFSGGSYGLDMRDMFPIANGPNVVSTTVSGDTLFSATLTNGFVIKYYGTNINTIGVRPGVERPQSGNLSLVEVYDPNNFLLATLTATNATSLPAPYIMNPTIFDPYILFSNTNIDTGATVTGTSFDDVLLAGGQTISVFGFGGNDTIYGNGDSNFLDGGSGNDTMYGGQGDDVFKFEIGDTVVETAGNGTRDKLEVVNIFIDLHLAKYAHIECVTLSGALNFDIAGDEAANELTGNAGNNIIYGAAGNDTLTGNDGNDRLYGGAEVDLLIGGAGNDILDGGAAIDAMVGGGGNDTYYFSDEADRAAEEGLGAVGLLGGVDTIISSGVSVDLNGTLGLARFQRFVENVTLLGSTNASVMGSSDNNVLIGNSGVNKIYGMNGEDRIEGGSGNDRLEGGSGNDTYVMKVGAGADTIIDSEGIDTIETEISFSLAALGEIDRIIMTGVSAINGTGNALNNLLRGNAAANRLDGGAGNDTIDGGLGTDNLIGGTGNDTFLVNVASDVIGEAVLGGTDLVLSSATAYTLSANLEILTLVGTLGIAGTGNAGNNTLNGNAAANRLDGGAGNDTLNGGLGTDTLIGGLGNDTFNLADGFDVVSDAGGIDTVTSTITRSIAALEAIENLTLLGTLAVNGAGNAGNNTITGNAAANRLHGGAGNDILNGGAGIDQLFGGDGNDTFNLGAEPDSVFGGGGIDTVTSTITRSIANLADVENVTLFGTTAINATGNNLGNVLTGNAARNELRGAAGNDTLFGGAGHDLLDGGVGNDTYIIADVEDITDSGGYDTVRTSVLFNDFNFSPTIEAFIAVGTADISVIANSADNRIIGNVGHNAMRGLFGADTMTGGAGDDGYFYFSIAESMTNGGFVDTITDFKASGADRIWLSDVDGNELADGVQNFNFIAVAGSTFSAAQQLRWYVSGGNTFLAGNTDNDQTAEFLIRLTGVKTITMSDLVIL